MWEEIQSNQRSQKRGNLIEWCLGNNEVINSLSKYIGKFDLIVKNPVRRF